MPIRTVLICHEEEPLNRYMLPRWLASWTELAGIVVLRETPERKRRRVKREMERVGILRFVDVLAFRLYYGFLLARRDRAWERQTLERLSREYPEIPATVRTLATSSPNTPEAQAFIAEAAPDVMIARCKTLLAQRIFSLPKTGTFVMHPGICPEYRNAHGCFWALALNDAGNAGMTLLKIDKGVDTGPVYGYFRCALDEAESHIVIQNRTVFDNLPAIAERLTEIVEGRAVPIDTRGRPSGEWGQPWLTKYLAWKRRVKR
jgi:folate-dependent phosphoribosylglycinamide formyltransferase PurN